MSPDTPLTDAERAARYAAWMEAAQYMRDNGWWNVSDEIDTEAARRYGPRVRRVVKLSEGMWYRVRDGVTKDSECPFEYTTNAGVYWSFSPKLREHATPGTLLGDLLVNPYEDSDATQ